MSWKKSFATASLRRQCLLLRLARYELQVENNCRKDTRPKLSQPSQSEAHGLKGDGCDSPHFNRPSNRQPTWTRTEGHLCWFSSKPVTTLNLSRLATSEAATPRTSVILRTVITGRSFLLKMVCPSTCDSNLNESRVSKRSSNGLLSKGKKTLLKAQETLVWSGISDYVRNAIKLCDVCQKYKPTQQKEPLIPHDNTLAKAILNRKISLKPWSKS